MIAESMPEISDNGRTYIFKLRRGIYFTPDPAFKGAKREVVAEDFVYAFKRFADPKIGMVSSAMPIGLSSNSSWLQSMRVEVSHCCCLPFS